MASRAVEKVKKRRLQRLCGACGKNPCATLTVPDHAEIDRGTLHAIYRQALRFMPDSELRPWFFTE